MNRGLSISLVILLALGGTWLYTKSDQEVLPTKLESRMVIDGRGKELEIPAQPKRVIVISAAGTGMYLAVSGGESMVGRIESNAFTEEENIKLNKLESVGKANGPNLEKILALKPDLVIGVEMLFQRQLEEPLKNAGIPLWLLKSGSIEENIEVIKIFGELTGKSEKAKIEIEKIHQAVADAMKRKDTKNVRVLPVFGTPESFLVALPASLPGDILGIAGGDNIGKNLTPTQTTGATMNYVPFSLEFALQENPDLILFITHGNPEAVKKSLTETLASNPAWLAIPAVRENRMEVLPFELFAINPGIRSSEAIDYLSKLLYPEGKQK